MHRGIHTHTYIRAVTRIYTCSRARSLRYGMGWQVRTEAKGLLVGNPLLTCHSLFLCFFSLLNIMVTRFTFILLKRIFTSTVWISVASVVTR
ncbi:hypothetical protein BDZ91DRAFT_730926 [Kalaharituber pfeilii]|nr:hypothetical protein BDZ91DRAFT_730926 [Kalaharituber pfeilii]